MKKECNTLDYYNKNAREYYEQTIVVDLQENYNKFLKYLKRDMYILDFGCGSGRDSKYFLEQGFMLKQ